jgi:hypothetical protein
MLGIHPGMMFLFIRRSSVSKTIMPRCLYPSGIAMKNDMLLDGNSCILFEI